MTSRQSLRGFLRQEVKRSRIKVKPESYNRRSIIPPPTLASRPPSSLDSFFEDGSGMGRSEFPQSISTDSLFGDRVCEEETKVIPAAEGRRQERLRKLIVEKDRTQQTVSKTKSFENAELDALKKELETLLTHELEASWEEKVEIRRRKNKVIQEVATIEAKDSERRAEKLKVHLDQAVKVLPEPVGPGEKKKMKLQAGRISKARAGLETSPQKRNRENLDHDLDGEDRLRLGKSFKKRVDTQITGHWKCNIHDYFPDADGDGKAGKLEGLTVAEKQFLRRELAELGEKLAKAERKKKFLRG